MNNSRRNHYVPKFLSSEFTDSTGALFFVNKRSKTMVVKSSTPNNLFVKRDLYRHDGDLINVTTNVEENFGKLESRFAPIHQEIIETIRNGMTPKLSLIKKSILTAFIVAQSRRTIDHRNRMQKTANDIIARRMKSLKQEIEKSYGPLTPEDEELIDSKAQEEYVRLVQLDGMASLSPNIQFELQQYVFRYLRIRNQEFGFVVGSNPVVWYQEMGRIVPNDQVKDVFLAVSSDIALKLVANSRGPRIVNLFGGNVVREWNEKIRDQSLMIAGPSRPLMRSLLKRED